MIKIKNRLFFILAFSMGLIVALSNYLVQFPVNFYGLNNILTYGAFSYPVAFLITDLANRSFGKFVARKIVYIGFLIGIGFTVLLSTDFADFISIRIAIGSGTAFLTAQLIDVQIFDNLRKKKWFIAPLTSSIIGSIIDTFVFFYIAFSASLNFIEPNNDVSWANDTIPLLNIFGFDAPFWISMAFADLFLKFLLALVFLIPFRKITLTYYREEAL